MWNTKISRTRIGERKEGKDRGKGKEFIFSKIFFLNLEEINLHNDSSQRELKKLIKTKEVCQPVLS